MIAVDRNDLVATSQVSGTDMSAVITSSPILMRHLVTIAFQPVYTGAPNGTFSIQFSIDKKNWATAATQIISTSGSWYMNMVDPLVTTPYVRIVWTPNVGSTGTLTNCWYIAKG
jgi:hypothetical protein